MTICGTSADCSVLWIIDAERRDDAALPATQATSLSALRPGHIAGDSWRAAKKERGACGWRWQQKSNDSLILLKLRAHKSNGNGDDRHGRHREREREHNKKPQREKGGGEARGLENKKAKKMKSSMVTMVAPEPEMATKEAAGARAQNNKVL